ncbi:MAG: histidine triad nucleotide-binding protein [Planctomycetota bacterium]
MDCLFCRIRDKKIPAKIVHDDDDCLAFEDINPQAPIHLLVVPKKHIPTVLDLSEEDDRLIGHVHRIAAELARRHGIAQPGFRLVVNCNAGAGQSVFHVHLHLLGGRPMKWPPG